MLTFRTRGLKVQETLKEHILESAKKQWQQLDITDDFIFSQFMRDASVCKEVLEILLPFKITHIEYVEYQKNIDIFKQAKSVRFDVYVRERDKVYNVEMQINKEADIAKRARFYQAAIDFDILEKGDKYKDLKESFVIFICTFDPFGYGLPCYNFRNICQENKDIELGDGRQVFFFNASAYSKEDDIRRNNFLAFIAGKVSDDPVMAKFAERIEKIKHNNILEDRYMYSVLKYHDAWYDGERSGLERGKLEGEKSGLERGKLEGEKRGLERGKLEIAKNFLGIVDDTLIAEKTGLSLDEVRALRR